MKERNSRRVNKRKSDPLESEQKYESVKEDLEYLKSALVNTQNMETFRTKLKATLDCRMEMVRDLHVDLLENFPFFFSNPEMVNVCRLIYKPTHVNLDGK